VKIGEHQHDRRAGWSHAGLLGELLDCCSRDFLPNSEKTKIIPLWIASPIPSR